MSSPRRHLDKYYTPAFATRELLNHIHLTGNVLECCSGDGAISKELKVSCSKHLGSGATIWTNDIDVEMQADFHSDMTQPWPFKFHNFQWIVTNPPFNQAPQIVPRAYDMASDGIAMLLRLSYLEPCFSRKSNRAQWLSEHPPNQLIVLPRISFTGNGKTDSVTCAWMIWVKGSTEQRIRVVPR